VKHGQGAANMKFEFFSIPACSPEQGQEELNSFCGSHRIASIEKQFVVNGEQSYWAICVSYLDTAKKITSSGKSKVDYREVLEERDFAVFAKLRSLRKTLAEKEGVPAYALFTNEQLADMVRDRVNSLSGMSSISGVGKSRIDKYGKEFLEILQKEFAENNSSEPKSEINETSQS
jgi:superfamily II DNA helicase RecQ